MAALVAVGDPLARVPAWKARTSCGADLLVHSQPAGNWKAKRRTRGKNSQIAAARCARAPGRCACASSAGQEPYADRGERDRHHARAGCLGLDADKGFHDWLLQNLDRVRIGLVEDGTAIGSAMAAAANRLNDKHSKSRVLVLLTDGENNAGKIPPNTAAEAVKALKIHFYAIGAGINGIAPAPIFTNRGPLTDALGNILYENQRVEFNETGLREVAKIADGKFFRATDTKSLEQIYDDIDKLEKSTVSVKKYQQYRDLFPLCLMGGCGLLAAQILLSQTVWKKLP